MRSVGSSWRECKRFHSSSCSLLAQTSASRSSGTCEIATSQSEPTTNFFFSQSFFWKFSSCARKSMTLPAIRLITLILDRYCSTLGAVSFSTSSRCITSFLM